MDNCGLEDRNGQESEIGSQHGKLGFLGEADGIWQQQPFALGQCLV